MSREIAGAPHYTDASAARPHEADIDTNEMPVLDGALLDDMDRTKVNSEFHDATRVDLAPVPPMATRRDAYMAPRVPVDHTERRLRRAMWSVGAGVVAVAAAYVAVSGGESPNGELPERPAVTTTSSTRLATTTTAELRRREPAPVVETTVPVPTTERPATSTTAAARRTTTTAPDLAQQIISQVEQQLREQLAPATTTTAETGRPTTTTAVGVPTTRLNRQASTSTTVG